jgi:SRSO17 transposase
VGSRLSAPGPQQKRFAAYIDGLAQAAGHADRETPLKNYCKGLLLPGDRKSVEPMAARLAPDNVRRMHQSLHHVVAEAPWKDEALLGQVRQQVLPSLQKQGPVIAWIVDDTGFPKKGNHSVGVARQYCGQVGKQDNCQVAVSLSVSTWGASLPIAWRLYLPEAWTQDRKRRKKAGIPSDIKFQTKPQIALDQIRQALQEGVPPGAVLVDAAYGKDTQFREEVTKLGLRYVAGVQSNTTVWEPGQQPLPAPSRKRMGRPPRLLQRSRNTSRSRRKTWRGRCPRRPGKTSAGAQEARELCAPALPLCACGRPIGITAKPNRMRKNGCLWNGRREKLSPPNTGFPRCPPERS